MARTKHPTDLLRHAGLRLKCVRLALGLGQEQMAEAIGVSRSAYNNFEHGTRTPDAFAMMRLELRFGVPMGWVFGGELRGLTHDMQERLLSLAADLGAELGGVYLPGMRVAEPMLVDSVRPPERKRTLHEADAPPISK